MGKVPAENLRWILDFNKIGCNSSQELKPLDTIIGQERAIRSLKVGMEIQEKGFNIYVAGPPGTGKTTSIRRFLEDISKGKPVPHDWCYVNNFQDSYRPHALSLSAGRAREFQGDVQNLVENAKREIRKAIESEDYEKRKGQKEKEIQGQKDELIKKINEEAHKEGFFIQSTPMGLITIPVKDGNPLSEQDFMNLSSEEKDEITKKRNKVQEDLKAVLRQIRALDKQTAEEKQKMDREVALYALGPLFEDLKEKYSQNTQVVEYLGKMQEDMLDNLNLFRGGGQAPQPFPPMPVPGAEDLPFRKYGVNVLVDNSGLEGAPVVMELNPTYNNLFGRMEKEAHFGALITDFTMIREGSLHRPTAAFWCFP